LRSGSATRHVLRGRVTAAELAARLEARPAGKGWQARCPSHEDTNPSLSISEGDEGRVLLKCHAGCLTETIVAALGLKLRDLFGDHSAPSREIVATYPYTDEQGEVLYEVVRFAPKDFRQRRPDGTGGWLWNLNGTRSVLYRLPQLRAAIAAGKRVFVCEGEKDVAAVERAGFCATCNAGGAGKWRDAYNAELRGADVVVVADKDPPGYAHARRIARSLQAVARRVVLVESAEGKDVSDHMAAGRTLGELVPIALDDVSPDRSADERPRIAGLLMPGTPTADTLIEKAGIAGLPQDPTTEAVETALRALVKLLDGADVLRVMSARTAAVRVLSERGVKYATQLVAAAMKLADDDDDVPPPPPADSEPWPESVNGAALLEEIQALVSRYVILPPGAVVTLSVFALASHAIDSFNTASYLFITSPTPECGKTRAIEVLELAVRRSWRPAILTGPVLFRGIEQYEPTLLIDEAEVVRQRSDAAENIRAILHFGYRRGATVDRCVGDNHELTKFRIFGFKVFACIGELPGTLLTRCIVIPMRRRRGNERVARFVPRDVEPNAVTLRRKCRRWAIDHMNELRKSVPTLPDYLEDRRREIWEPLFAVAEAAGWSVEIEQAAKQLSGARPPETDGVELLADIREVFAMRGVDRLASADLLTALNAMEGRPWADLNRGRGLTAHRLARELKPFGVAPGTIRVDTGTPKGYLAERFADAFERYLPLRPAPETATPPQAAPALDDLRENEPPRPAPCGGSPVRENQDRTGIVAMLLSGERRGGARDRSCPRCHGPMTHHGTQPDAGWVCKGCYPEADAAMRGEA
jgi:5S rRNA maturation endonuclease (ribonuclease M5)